MSASQLPSPEELPQIIEEESEAKLKRAHMRWTSGHVHVWREEYDECMIKGCGVKKNDKRE